MEKKYLLDIGIPCFNHNKYLKRCLESIKNIFYEDRDKILIWICDDCSDYSKEYINLIEDYKNIFDFKYIKNEINSGPGITRNHVIHNGTSDYITFIDDDDIFCANPIPDIENNTNKDFLYSEIQTNKGKSWSSFDSYLGVINGMVFSRDFIKNTNLMFPLHLFKIGTEDSVFRMLVFSFSENFSIIPNFILRMEREEDEEPSCFSYMSFTDENRHLSINNDLNIFTNFIWCKNYKHFIKNYKYLYKGFYYIFSDFLDRIFSFNNFLIRNHYIVLFYILSFYIYYLFFQDVDLSNYFEESHQNEILFVKYAVENFCHFKNEKTLIYVYDRNKKNNLDLSLIPTVLKTHLIPNIFNYEDYFNYYIQNYWLTYKKEQEEK